MRIECQIETIMTKVSTPAVKFRIQIKNRNCLFQSKSSISRQQDLDDDQQENVHPLLHHNGGLAIPESFNQNININITAAENNGILDYQNAPLFLILRDTLESFGVLESADLIHFLTV